MAKKRRRRKHRKNPANPANPRRRRRSHRRRKNPGNPGNPSHRRHHRRRRRNPGSPLKNLGSTLIGIGIGAGAGAGVGYGADKLGIATPAVRNWGMVGLGALAAVGIGMFSPGVGAGVGTGIAAVGLSRVATSMLGGGAPARQLAARGKLRSIKGLGSGEGWGDAGEVDGPYDQLGDVEEVIEYVEGPDDTVGNYVDMGDVDVGEVISDADGAFDQVGDTDGAFDQVGDVEEVEEVIGLVEGAEDVGDYEGIGLYENDA